jgi:hypothetical protein
MVKNSQQNQKPAHTEYPHRISTLFRSHPSKCYTKREWFVLSSVFGIRSVGETIPIAEKHRGMGKESDRQWEEGADLESLSYVPIESNHPEASPNQASSYAQAKV